MSLQQQQLGGLGAQAGCGQLGSAFGALSALGQQQAQLRMNSMYTESLHKAETRTVNFKYKPDGLREELQAETDEWLKEAIK